MKGRAARDQTGNIHGQKPNCEEPWEHFRECAPHSKGSRRSFSRDVLQPDIISKKKNSSDDRVKNELKSLLYSHRPENAGTWSRVWQWGNREGKLL